MRARTLLLTGLLAALALPAASADDPTDPVTAAGCLADSVGGTAYQTAACVGVRFYHANCFQNGVWLELHVGPVTLVDQRCTPPDS